MASSTERADALRALGALLTGTEARVVAAGLEDEESVPSAFSVVDADRRAEALALVSAAGLRTERGLLIDALRAIEGAHSVTSKIDTLWTMPGHLAQSSGLTSSLVQLVASARSSVVCSTFNFQKSSGLWGALREAASRAGVAVRVYLDAGASDGSSGPSAADVAAWLAPALVLRTKAFDGKPVRNHAKFLSVDHRFVVVTSANFSWSAEYENVELGVRIDDVNLADRVERELREVEAALYDVVR